MNEVCTCQPVGAVHHWHDIPIALAQILEVCCRCGSVRVTLRKEQERDISNPGCLAEIGVTDFIRVDPHLVRPDLMTDISSEIDALRAVSEDLGMSFASKRQDDAEQGMELNRVGDLAIALSGRIEVIEAELRRGDPIIEKNVTDINALRGNVNSLVARVSAAEARLTVIEDDAKQPKK